MTTIHEGGENTLNKDDFRQLGSELKHMVKDIFAAGETVNTTLDSAISEVQKAISSIQAGFIDIQKRPQRRVDPPATFPHRPVGKAAGILCIIFGSIMSVGFGLTLLVLAGLSSLAHGLKILPFFMAVPSLLLIAGITLLFAGIAARRMYKRYLKYMNLLTGRNSCMFRELSLYTGFSEKYILKDMRRMIRRGFFPDAHIDDERTMVMLNREVYDIYLAHQAEYRARLKAAPAPKPDSKITHAVDEGTAYIRQINDAKRSITDREVYAKVQQLEVTISRILSYVEANPGKLPEVRRLMAYYLPTTVKLLGAYRDFDRQPIQGDNIVTAKREIKDALDTINIAFENLFDSLFEAAMLDISTDISVLKSVFMSEGLTDGGFKSK